MISAPVGLYYNINTLWTLNESLFGLYKEYRYIFLMMNNVNIS